MAMSQLVALNFRLSPFLIRPFRHSLFLFEVIFRTVRLAREVTFNDHLLKTFHHLLFPVAWSLSMCSTSR